MRFVYRPICKFVRRQLSGICTPAVYLIASLATSVPGRLGQGIGAEQDVHAVVWHWLRVGRYYSGAIRGVSATAWRRPDQRLR